MHFGRSREGRKLPVGQQFLAAGVLSRVSNRLSPGCARMHKAEPYATHFASKLPNRPSATPRSR